MERNEKIKYGKDIDRAERGAFGNICEINFKQEEDRTEQGTLPTAIAPLASVGSATWTRPEQAARTARAAREARTWPRVRNFTDERMKGRQITHRRDCAETPVPSINMTTMTTMRNRKRKSHKAKQYKNTFAHNTNRNSNTNKNEQKPLKPSPHRTEEEQWSNDTDDEMARGGKENNRNEFVVNE